MERKDFFCLSGIDWSKVKITASNPPPHFLFAPSGQPALSVSPEGVFTWADNAAELIERTSDGATRAILRELWKAKTMGDREASLEAQCAGLVERVSGMQRKLAKQGQTIARHGADVQRMAWLEAELDKVRPERDQLQQRVDNCLSLADQQQARITELEAQLVKAMQRCEDMKQTQQVDTGAVVAELQHNLSAVSRERDNYRAALEAWQEKTEWVQQTAIGSELGKHRADVMRERLNSLQRTVDNWNANMAWARDGRFPVQVGTHLGEVVGRQFEAMQRRRDELSARLADEQRRCFAVNPLDGVGAMALERYCRHFRSNLGTPVKLSANDALRVFELAIKALDQPGELGEVVGQLRRHAAQVQSTAERLTQLTAKK